MNAITLTGLDGANPLGFLAALGVLAAADAVAPGARLAWKSAGRWRPVLTTTLDRSGLLDCLLRDLRTWDDDPAVALSYEKAGKDKTDKPEKSGKAKAKAKAKASADKPAEAKVARDLKPTIGTFRAYLSGLISVTERDAQLAAFLHGARRPLDYAAAFGTDVAVDGNGNVKPTALHFTAGQQEFLKAVLELIDPTDGVTGADLEEAVFGPWMYRSNLAVQSWDSSGSRDYALRADDPSKNKKLGVPGADWLGFRGMVFLPVAPIRKEIVTTGCSGDWKVSNAFTWALWREPANVSAVRSILTLADVQRLDIHSRHLRGIEQVFRARIKRADQGGRGSFVPAEVIPPSKR